MTSRFNAEGQIAHRKLTRECDIGAAKSLCHELLLDYDPLSRQSSDHYQLYFYYVKKRIISIFRGSLGVQIDRDGRLWVC
jgi:hypothetical protein